MPVENPHGDCKNHIHGATDKGYGTCYCCCLAVYVPLVVLALVGPVTIPEIKVPKLGTIFPGQTLDGGNIKRLTHGFDYKGRICDVDEGVQGKPFVLFCGYRDRAGQYPVTLNRKARTCVSSCPTDDSQFVDCLTTEVVNITSEGPRNDTHGITYLKTLHVRAMQSVAQQKTYPTEEYRGKYCLPKWEWNNTLRDQIVRGVLYKEDKLASALGSLRHGWLVVLGAGVVLPMIMGMIYLFMLRNYAGGMIMLTLKFAQVVLPIFGLFFCLAIFFDPWNTEGGYQKSNPFFVAMYGYTGKHVSILVGLVFFGLFFTLYSFAKDAPQRINEIVGIINAAVECVEDDVWFLGGAEPIGKAIALAVAVIGLAIGYALLISFGDFDNSNIQINGKGIAGLTKEFKHPWGWWVLEYCYFAFSIWTCIGVLHFFHLGLCTHVIDWFFQDYEKGSVKYCQPVLAKGDRMHAQVSVAGFDNFQGQREAYVTNVDGNRLVQFYVGKPGPDGRYWEPKPTITGNKRVGMLLWTKGIWNSWRYFFGSVCFGALWSTVTIPFRALGTFFRSIVGTNRKRTKFDDLDNTVSGSCTAFMSLLATYFEESFGPYNRNTYAAVAFEGHDFYHCGEEYIEFIAEVGGAVAFMHGSCTVYSAVATWTAALVCAGIAMILFCHIPAFYDSSSEENLWGGYVEDPMSMTGLVFALSAFINHGFCELVPTIADVLLYAFAINRKRNRKFYVPHPPYDASKGGKDGKGPFLDESRLEKNLVWFPFKLEELVGGELKMEPGSVLHPQASKDAHFLAAFREVGGKAAGHTMNSIAPGVAPIPVVGGTMANFLTTQSAGLLGGGHGGHGGHH